MNLLPNGSSAGLFSLVLCGVALCCLRYLFSLMYGSSLSTPDVWPFFLRCFMTASARSVALGSSALLLVVWVTSLFLRYCCSW